MPASPPLWAEIAIPPRPDLIRSVQQMARTLADQCGIDAARGARIELALEEVLSTILRLSFDGLSPDDARLTIRCESAPPYFSVTVIDSGLPFDLSMVSPYDPQHPETADRRETGLSVHLVRHSVDRCSVLQHGRGGMRFEMAWLLPASPAAGPDAPPDAPPEPAAPETPPEPVESVRLLGEEFAIQIARLVFRGYGWSYVYEDVYYPERLAAHFRSGAMKSWGAVTTSGQLVGHLALVRESPDAGALEWCIAVVDPRWRGLGLMERMLQAAMDHADTCPEPILCAHAVTAHPYTQKTCLKFGFQPVALLLGYAPATMQFRGIRPELSQRESTFLCARCTHPLPDQTLYLPPRHAPAIQRLLDALGARPPDDRLIVTDTPPDLSGRVTEYASVTAHCINVAKIQIESTGGDVAAILARERRRLCGERVDVIYLTLDLADPGAPLAIRAAGQCGFFLAGLTPMLNPAYGLTLQYLNNVDVDFDSICAQGPTAQWLRDTVAADRRRLETGA